jgi:hypothetical protein
MNPKSINDLDPKLKETYERVMGTSLGTNPIPTPPVMTTQQTPEPQPVTQPAPEQSPKPQMQVKTSPTASTNEGTTVSQVFRADNQNKTNEPATVSSPSFKKAASTKTNINKLLPIIVVVAIVFFIVYGVVWAKLLGLF